MPFPADVSRTVNTVKNAEPRLFSCTTLAQASVHFSANLHAGVPLCVQTSCVVASCFLHFWISFVRYSLPALLIHVSTNLNPFCLCLPTFVQLFVCAFVCTLLCLCLCLLSGFLCLMSSVCIRFCVCLFSGLCLFVGWFV